MAWALEQATAIDAQAWQEKSIRSQNEAPASGFDGDHLPTK